MSNANDTRPLPASAHMRVDLGVVQVRPIKGHPGHYVIYLGEYNDLSIHVTVDQWHEIEQAVRAGLAAATQAVAS